MKPSYILLSFLLVIVIGVITNCEYDGYLIDWTGEGITHGGISYTLPEPEPDYPEPDYPEPPAPEEYPIEPY